MTKIMDAQVRHMRLFGNARCICIIIEEVKQFEKDMEEWAKQREGHDSEGGSIADD